jgi:hypothetical protein
VQHAVRSTLLGELWPAMPPSTTTWPTWMFCGPYSRAMLWLRLRTAALAEAKGAKFALPRKLPEAPVKNSEPPPWLSRTGIAA